MNLTDQPRAFDPETYPDVFPTTADGGIDLDQAGGTLVLATAANWMVDRLRLGGHDDAADAQEDATTAALDAFALLDAERNPQ